MPPAFLPPRACLKAKVSHGDYDIIYAIVITGQEGGHVNAGPVASNDTPGRGSAWPVPGGGRTNPSERTAGDLFGLVVKPVEEKSFGSVLFRPRIGFFSG